MDAAPIDDERRRYRAACRRKSAIGFGVALICALFILETQSAHRLQPHPASHLVWALLAAVAAGGVACGIWFRVRAGGGR